MQTAPDQSLILPDPDQSGAASASPSVDVNGLTAADRKMIREENARHYAKERARDARRLAAYQRECLASWGAV